MGEVIRMIVKMHDVIKLMFIVLITTVLIFVVLISIISAYAKSIKEDASLTVP